MRQPGYGWVFGGQVGEVDGDIFGEFRRREVHIPFKR